MQVESINSKRSRFFSNSLHTNGHKQVRIAKMNASSILTRWKIVVGGGVAILVLVAVPELINNFRAPVGIGTIFIGNMSSKNRDDMRKDVGGEVRENDGRLRNKALHNSMSGSTGKRFSGSKIRAYNIAKKSSCRFQNVAPIDRSLFDIGPEDSCSQWAVVTTIHVPNESIFSVSKLNNWCLVIVGDNITPEDKHKELAKRETVFFLSASYQKQTLESNSFIRLMPFNSFARKNIGYLFALYYGAKVIYDFDDDNVLAPLEDATTVQLPFIYKENIGFENTALVKYVQNLGHDDVESKAFNPYAYMNPSHAHSWPRGFPVDQLQKNFDLWDSTNTTVGDIKYSSIGVIQSLCDGDPDNDAVFRMTRRESTKFTFDRSKTALPLLIPASMYTPYNAQATTHLYNAFWGLYLPISVPGRVTDIWRSYITQRIMKEVGLHVMYTPPIVNHERSSHDYLADFEAESDLYSKTTSLLSFLDNWVPTANSFAETIFELWVALYEHDYIGLSDVEAMEEWLSFLLAIEYEFPSIQRKTEKASNAVTSSVQFQPAIEGQPYRSFLHSTQENKIPGERSENAVLKIIMMTMDEWPLLKSWVLYHGHLLGFEHLYILDGSSDTRCIAFLRYARDTLGANVIFTRANLNEMESVMTGIAKDISSTNSSDFIVKMDTDEFLVVYDNSTQMLTTSIQDYLADLRLDGDSRFGYSQSSFPSSKVCSEDIYSTPDKFPLHEPAFIGTGAYSYFKMVYNSKLPFAAGERIINLGGHAHSVKDGIWTNLGVVHYHFRCVEIEVENCKRVLENHEYILPSDSDEAVTAALAKRFNCDTKDICNSCAFDASFASVHKAVFYLKWLNCPEHTKAEYYNNTENLPQLKNAAVVETMQMAYQLFDI